MHFVACYNFDKADTIGSFRPLEHANDRPTQKPIFLDETAARDWLEARVWASGRVCPHCGNADQDKITKLEGKAHGPGVYQCNETECRQQFTVTVNTVFERSKIPLTKWFAALFLMTASKKGIRALRRLAPAVLTRTLFFRCLIGIPARSAAFTL